VGDAVVGDTVGAEETATVESVPAVVQWDAPLAENWPVEAA